jgi:hypothetical protein
MEMNLIDFSFAAMDSKQRSLDFALIGEFKKPLSVKHLREGSKLAFSLFPKSACRIEGYEWIPDNKSWDIQEASFKNEDQMMELFNQGFNLNQERGIKQYLVSAGSKTFLITRMHHALGDGLSLLLWLKAQLNHLEFEDQKLIMKSHSHPVMKSEYAESSPSHPFRMRSASSSERKTAALEFEMNLMNFKSLPFSYNDFISAVLFKSMKELNESKNLTSKRLCLYIPVNIRQNPFSGFGNGSSRIKIYPPKGSTLFSQCLQIREQVKWCKENGLWSVNHAITKIKRMPKFVAEFLLKIYAQMPWIEMGSMVFSHIESYQGLENVFSHFKTIKGISQLYKKYSMGITAVSHEGKTVLTLTWDPARFNEGDIYQFNKLIQKNWVDGIQQIKTSLV